MGKAYTGHRVVSSLLLARAWQDAVPLSGARWCPAQGGGGLLRARQAGLRFGVTTDLAVYKSVQVEGRREGDFLLHYWALSEILLSLTNWLDVA